MTATDGRPGLVRRLGRFVARHRVWTGAVVLAVLAAVAVPVALTMTGRPTSTAPPVSPAASAVLEELSRNPAEARTFLDPGRNASGEVLDDVNRLWALISRDPATLDLLAAGKPSLPGFASYRSIGDIVLTTGSDPDDPVAQRITEAALGDIDGVPTRPAEMSQMQPQITRLVITYLQRGYIGFDSPDRAESDFSLDDLIRHGYFTDAQLDSMADTLVSTVADQYGVTHPADGLLALDPVSQYGTAFTLGAFLHLVYAAEVFRPGASSGAVEQHVSAEVDRAADRLYAALSSRPSTAPLAGEFVALFRQSANAQHPEQL